MTTIPRPLALALLVLLAGPVAAEPLPGLWERRFTGFLPDPVSGVEKRWAEPADTRCLSEADLRKLPFLTAAASKVAHERDGGSCTVSGEAHTREAASWSLVCKEAGGRAVETRMSVEISDTRIVSLTRRITPDNVPGAQDVRVEVRMTRLGDCDGGAAKKP